jgi:hypothetical protein
MSDQTQIRNLIKQQIRVRNIADESIFYSSGTVLVVLIITLLKQWKFGVLIILFFGIWLIVSCIIWVLASDVIAEQCGELKNIRTRNRRKKELADIKRFETIKNTKPVITTDRLPIIVNEEPTPPDCEHCSIYREEGDYVICPDCGKFI